MRTIPGRSRNDVNRVSLCIFPFQKLSVFRLLTLDQTGRLPQNPDSNVERPVCRGRLRLSVGATRNEGAGHGTSTG